jgi:hypothetical protein
MKTEVAVPAGANCADATITLGPKAAKLRVTVINGMTQEPINGTTISEVTYSNNISVSDPVFEGTKDEVSGNTTEIIAGCSV